MKTKHLFATMMLPALFAACTNEELISTTTTNPSDLSDRPIAGDVRLNFSMDNDIMTRLDNNFKWTANDKIGACLMDDYNATVVPAQAEEKAPWMANYTFIDYIHTNYRYTFDGEETWNNGDLLCQGNYFFYYPYDANLNSRTAFEKYLNANQELKDLKNPRQLINDNQMYLGYKYVEGATEGDTQPLNVDLKPVFAFPAFIIKNEGSAPRTIEKIALQYQDGNKVWELVATVDPTQVTTNPATTYAEDATKAVKWSATPTLDKKATGSAKQIQVTMPENTVLGANETLNTYIVVPAGEYGTTDKVTLYIYTTDGVVTAPLDAKHENSSTGGSGSKQFNVTNDVAFEDIYPYTVAGKYFVCNVGFDNLAVEKPGETTISSTEDLDTYLSWFKNTSGTGGVALTINTLGDGVELSKAAYDILNGNKLIKATFKGNLTLAEGVGSNVLDLITIDGAVAHTLTNKADINVPVLDRNVTLVNEGTITLSSTTAYTNKFENNGTMNVTAPNAQSTVTLNNLQAGDFANNGKLNINGNMSTGGAAGIVNNGEVNILSGTTNGKISNSFTAKNESYTNGVINVAAGATWTVAGTIATNSGVINNNGTISVPNTAKFVNNAAQSYGTKGATFMPNIVNNGSITGITNNGLVKQASANASYITTGITGATGRVDNTVISQKTVASDNETIIVTVTEAAEAAELNTLLGRAQAEAVVFDNAGSLNVTSVEEGVTEVALFIPTVEINGNLNIDVLEGVTLNIRREDDNQGATSIIVKSGTTSLVNDTYVTLGTSSYGSKVIVNEGAALNVNANATLESINIDFTNNGKIRNYGTIIDRETTTVDDWEGKAPVTK